MLIQSLITLLALAVLVGVARRFKAGAISRAGLLFWVVFWAIAVLLVWNPNITNLAANFLGVGRGADAVFYVAIAALFYTIFRLYGKLENLEHQLSELAKKIALKDFREDK
ncbi:MAG: hypothetical protein UX98_C0001G0016 [Parcubacteria group bacterium GW2011_GWA2_47_26]|nr:MAG: hypothetical protein UX98_C0001G0016 [Parcubacteria group bacterium GW2011_GWA2_47_26]